LWVQPAAKREWKDLKGRVRDRALDDMVRLARRPPEEQPGEPLRQSATKIRHTKSQDVQLFYGVREREVKIVGVRAEAKWHRAEDRYIKTLDKRQS
jgi:mRNA-degrading endonuclease RelE of RelBE toxin-antitoxin system